MKWSATGFFAPRL